jgi:hypothetical protein
MSADDSGHYSRDYRQNIAPIFAVLK